MQVRTEDEDADGWTCFRILVMSVVVMILIVFGLRANVSGAHGGSRQECQLFTSSERTIVEFHAWQLIKHNPR
jgi:hypothetical protein